MAERTDGAQKPVSVVVQPGRSVLAADPSSIKTQKIPVGKDAYEERTVLVRHIRHDAGAIIKVAEDEAKHLIERGFVKPVE